MDHQEHSILLSAIKFISGNTTHICRLCFAPTESKECFTKDSVKVERYFHEDVVTYADMFGQLGVASEETLPQVLCMECADAVINSYLFLKLCHYSDDKWTSAIRAVENSLSKWDLVNPATKTAYILVDEAENVIFTSKKICNNKADVITKIKSIANSRKKNTKKKKKDSVACKDCGDIFDSKMSLNKHNKVHNNKKNKYACEFCAKPFTSKMLRDDHAERVHYPKTIPCIKCSKKFATEKMLQRHTKLEHMAAICKLCFIQFPSKLSLRAHLDKHDVNECQLCKKTFLNRHTYKLHTKLCGNSDSKQISYFCDICQKGYVRKNSLRTHLKTDHGFGRVINCQWCSKKFDAVSKLRLHVVKHTKERNFYCEHCGSRFVTQAALVYHVRLHTGERPYPCDMCSESFLSASRRMEHKRRKHFEPTKECPMCHVKFVTGNQLKKHVQRHYNPQSKLYIPSVVTPSDTDIFNLPE